MKKMTKKIITLLTAFILAVCSVPATAQAAREPYCFPNYSHELGADVIDYFEYGSDGIAAAISAKRLILDGSVLRTGGGDTISTNFKAGSTVSWFNATKVAWQKTNNIVYVWDFITKKNSKIAVNVEKILLNYDFFAAQVLFKNGSKKSIASLIKEAGSGFGTGSESTSSTTKEVLTSTDGGKTTITFDGNRIVSQKADVIYNGKKLSQYCKSGIRFLAVIKNGTSEYFIFVYEDDDNAMYRFDTADIYNPVEIDFTGEIKSATFDSLGYGDKLVTSTSVSSFSKLKEKEDTEDHAINKSTYSTLLLEDGGQHEIRRKGTNLYLDGILISGGLKAKKYQFGFLDANTITLILSGNQYKADIKDPLHLTFVKADVKSLVPSKANGFMIGAK